MATKGSIPAGLLQISGVIGLRQTLFTWQNLVMITVLVVISVWICYVSTPTAEHAKTAEMAGITYKDSHEELGTAQTPGEKLEFSPVLTIVMVAIGLVYLVNLFRTQGGLAALDLNTYNFIFLFAGMLLHWRPRSFLRAAARAVPMTGGVLIQFPLYAGIFGVLMGSHLNEVMARFFVSISSHAILPLVGGIYSAILGLFLPSGGGKWVVEAPYLLDAAKSLHVNMAWMVQVYNAAEALPELHQPVLDAPADGPDRGQGARPGRLFDPADDLPCAGGPADALAPGPDPALRRPDHELMPQRARGMGHAP